MGTATLTDCTRPSADRASIGAAESLPALTLTPLHHVLPDGSLVRVTTAPAPMLLNGLFGDQAWLALQLVAGLNPTANPSLGGVGLVRESELPRGEGAGWILAPFVRTPGPGNGSRFSDGAHGVWYGANTLPTAQAEVGYHPARWLATSEAAPDRLECSVVIAHADRGCPLVDLRSAEGLPRDVLHPGHYVTSQPFGAACRRTDFWGLLWPSVRAEGLSAGSFRPRALRQAQQLSTCHAIWDGMRVTWA